MAEDIRARLAKAAQAMQQEGQAAPAPSAPSTPSAPPRPAADVPPQPAPSTPPPAWSAATTSTAAPSWSAPTTPPPAGPPPSSWSPPTQPPSGGGSRSGGRSGRVGTSVAAIVLRVVIGFVVVGVAGFIYRVASGTEGDKPISDASVGQCINYHAEKEVGVIKTYKSVSCTKAHDREVYAVVTSPENRSYPYPGLDAITKFGGEQCGAAFESYVGIPYEDSSLRAAPLYPTESAWKNGERRTICVIRSGDGSKLTQPVHNAKI